MIRGKPRPVCGLGSIDVITSPFFIFCVYLFFSVLIFPGFFWAAMQRERDTNPTRVQRWQILEVASDGRSRNNNNNSLMFA